MADYYPLVARAVAGLEKNTGEARRALYERARAALVAQLRGVDPPLEEAEITRERLALEEAIRKVETEAARRARQEAVAQPQPAPQPAPAPRPAPAPATGARVAAASPDLARPDQARPGPARPAAAAVQKPLTGAMSQPQMGAALRKPAPAPHPSASPQTSLTDEAMRGFRESAGKPAPARPAALPPQPAAAAPKPKMPPRDPFAELSAAHDFDQLEPKTPSRLDADALRPKRRDTSLVDSLDEFEEPEPMPSFGPAPRGMEEEPPRPPRNYAGLIKIGIAAAVVVGLVGFLYWQRDTLTGLYQAFRGVPQPQQAQPEAPQQQGRPKISDRIGPGTPRDQAQVPAVAQRVVLYEEEPSEPQGKRFIGSVIWRTENVSSGPGQPADIAVRADVEIPERRMTMTFTLRRNTDQTLPASHTAEVVFNLPADFPGGGISNVPGILMKQAEQTRGTPLAGIAVKVTGGFFLIGLSAVESELQRNVALLKERSWFDIPIVYNNNRRAILALEKGTPGERAFAEAFAAWRQ
jgi:hypothetical protein